MLNALLAEELKWRHTSFSRVTVAAALSAPLLSFLSYFVRGATPTWDSYLTNSILYFSVFLGPLIITLIGAQSIFCEYQYDTWKLSLTGPLPRRNIYLAKVIIGLFWVGMVSTLAIGGDILVGFALKAKGIFIPVSWLKSLIVIWLGGFALLPFFQFITFITRSFFFTSGVGIIGTFAGLMILQSKYSGLYPFSSVYILADRFGRITPKNYDLLIGRPELWAAILAGVLLFGFISSLIYIIKSDPGS